MPPCIQSYSQGPVVVVIGRAKESLFEVGAEDSVRRGAGDYSTNWIESRALMCQDPYEAMFRAAGPS